MNAFEEVLMTYPITNQKTKSPCVRTLYEQLHGYQTHAKQNKPDTKEYVLYDFTYIKLLKRQN